MDTATKEFLEAFAEVLATAHNKPRERDGRLADFAGLPPPPPSVSVKDDWASYIKARQEQSQLATWFLTEALTQFGAKTIKQGAGRTPFPLRDKLFLCIEKVHRRHTYDSFTEFIEYAKLKGYTSSMPQPHSVADFMNDAQLTSLLERLVTFTSTPLGVLEEEFAIDSTGLGTYGKRWVTVRLDLAEHRAFRKLHLLIGVRTGIITAAAVTQGLAGDSPQFALLLDRMKRYFTIKELSGDAAYASRVNAQLVEDVGGRPYFKLKLSVKNAMAKAKGHFPAWVRMIRMSRQNPELYKAHYSKRSNVESTNASLKRTIRDHLESKNVTAQENEALCIAVVHNLGVLARTSVRFGIGPDYRK